MYSDEIYDVPVRQTRKWATFCHLGGLARVTFIPLGAIIVPLIIWLAKRDEHPYIDEQGKEAVNFQMTMSVCNFVLLVVGVVLSWIWLGWLLWPVGAAIWLAQIGGAVYAAIKTTEGEKFSYPFSIRFIS